jgi:Resolvase, N terminal domain
MLKKYGVLSGTGAVRRRWGRNMAAREGTVVVYLRVSTSAQAASGLGIEAQRATAQVYVERKGLTIVDEFCDEGVNAKPLSARPGALAGLAAVRFEEFSHRKSC